MAAALVKRLLEDFECSICFNYMHPPIPQCPTGHSFCKDCFEKFEICPLCQVKKKYLIKNIALEGIHALLSFPCKYEAEGCKVLSIGKDVEKHQDSCDVALDPCPLKPLFFCLWKGEKTGWAEHLQETHPFQFHDGNEKRLVFKDLKGILSQRHYMIFYAYDEYFRFIYEIDYPGVSAGKLHLLLHDHL